MVTERTAAGTDMNGSVLFGHARAERSEANLSFAVAKLIEFDEQRVSVIHAVPVGVVDDVSLHREDIDEWLDENVTLVADWY